MFVEKSLRIQEVSSDSRGTDHVIIEANEGV